MNSPGGGEGEQQAAVPHDVAVAMYGGEDGVLDAVEEVMMKYDKDKNGNFSMAEVKAIVQDLEQKKSHVKNLQKLVIAVVLTAIVACSVLFGLMFASNEAAKENHTTEGVMKGLDGETVQVATVESFTTLWDLPKVPMDMMAKIKTVNLFIDVANHPKMQAGLYESEFKVASASKLEQTNLLYMRTYEGYLISIDGSTNSGTIYMEEQEFPIYATSAKDRRLEGYADHIVETIACSADEEYCMPKRLPKEMHGRRLMFGGATASGTSVCAFDAG